MRAIEWTQLQQQELERIRERIITIDRTWVNRAEARDHYVLMSHRFADDAAAQQSPHRQAFRRQVATMYLCAARLTDRRRTS